MLRSIAFSAAILVGAGAIHAADAPATAPATAPAASNPAFVGDWSTPKAALLTYLKALGAQDNQAAVKSVAWDNPAEAKTATDGLEIVKTEAQMFVEQLDLVKQHYAAEKPLQDALARVHAGIDQVAGGYQEAAQMIEAQSATAEIKIDGEKATLQMRNSDQVFKFKKVENQWGLLPESAGPPVYANDPDERKQMALELDAARKAVAIEQEGYRIFAADLKAGKYATGMDAISSLVQISPNARAKAMMQAGLLGDGASATQAAPEK